MAIKYPKFRCTAVIPANAGIQPFQHITGFTDKPGNDIFNCRINSYLLSIGREVFEESIREKKND